MDREILFAKTLEQVRAAAKEQGNCTSKEQVREAFAALELDDKQMQMVFDYLESHGIGLGEQDGSGKAAEENMSGQTLSKQPLPEQTLSGQNSADQALADNLSGKEPSGKDSSDKKLSNNKKPSNNKNLSNKEKSYLQNYLDELEGLPIYSEGEKEAFTISAMAGEKDAQKKLVEVYLKDVVGIARLYTGQGVSLEDLIGEGNMALTFGVGMLGGLERPKEAEGTLVRLIMGAMEDLIKENEDNTKTDRRILDKVNEVHDKAKELAEELNRKVTVEELAAMTELTEQSIREAMRFSGFQIDYITRD